MAALALAGLVLVLAILRGRQPQDSGFVLAGRTMGSTYHITVAAALQRAAQVQLHQAVEDRLGQLNSVLSIYQSDSAISHFNQITNRDPVAVNQDLHRVLAQALEIATRTGGAMDPTVAPLAELWGFGPAGRPRVSPGTAAVAAARAQVGYGHVELTPDGKLAKTIPGLRLDLGAVAQGFGVDEIGQLLTARGYTNFLVEIGGEALAMGRFHGRPWRIGIQRPDFSAAPGQKLMGVATLSGWAISTSGNYQNYYRDAQGELRSHIIDPRTGYPVAHAMASVTVVARNCSTADGLATAAYVLGPDAGLRLLEEWPDVEALLVLRGDQDGYAIRATSGFNALTAYEAVETADRGP